MPRVVATEEDWLREGLRRFSSGGVAALRVEAMARTLKCAKSSFYWHFQGREAFIDQMLQFWAQLGTDAVIARLSTLPTPAARFRALIIEAFSAREGADFLFHLRHLARDNPHAASLLHQTESQRIGYIAGLLAESGLSDDASAGRAELVYGYYLGWYERNKHRDVSSDELDAIVVRIVRGMSLPASFL